MFKLLLVAVLLAVPPKAENPVAVSVGADVPVVVTKPGYTCTVYGDRVVVQVNGSPKPLTLVLDSQDPAPGPAPNPPPTPTPTPDPVIGYKGDLWGVLVLPDDYGPGLGALRTSSSIRAVFDADKQAYWQSGIVSEYSASPGYADLLKKVNGPPAVVWIGTGGKVLSVTSAKDEAGVIAEFKRIRGAK